MSLPHINSFETKNPEKLSRQLSDLEDNVDAELKSVRNASEPKLSPVTFRSMNVASGIVNVMFGNQLSVDTNMASAAVVFPALNASNFGRRFVLIKRSGVNSIVTSCQDPSVLCNAAAFPTLTAAGAYAFYCDASGYYR